MSLKISTDNRSLLMAKFIHPKIRRMQNAESVEKYQDEQDRKQFFADYNKEKDRTKKIEMLRTATQNAWI